MEQVFRLKTHWSQIQLVPSDNRKLTLWKNGSSLVKVAVLGCADHPKLYALLRVMDDSLPYCGGVAPSSWLKNPQPTSREERRQYFDGRLLVQYLNLNEFLQKKLAEEAGCARGVLLEKIRELIQAAG